MIIIPDNATLHQYIPNVVMAVDGESTLFEKILPQLEATEQWVISTLINASLLSVIASDTTALKYKLTATLIASEAMCRAVPSLDLVLTPNGYGVVNNANVAPASKERVLRLQASLRDARDRAMELLLLKELRSEDWPNTAQGQWLRSSFFVAPVEDTTAAKAVIQNEDRWQGFLELREKARPIEQAIAQRWLGQALTARLRAALASDYYGSSDTVALAKTIRTLIIDELISGKRPVKNLDRCVNYIRNNDSLYPEWQSDPVAELFVDKWRFQNKKEAPGYFF